MSSLIEKYHKKAAEITDVKKALSVLRWDQEVNMPANGAETRSRHIGTLSSVLHEMQTDPAYEEVLQELRSYSDLDFKTRRNVEETLRTIERSKKYPKEFVTASQKAVSRAFQSWRAAKEANDYKQFAGNVSELLKFKLEETELLGYEEHPYNALLDLFDTGLTVKKVDNVFSRVKTKITDFIDELGEKKPPEDKFLRNKFNTEKQFALCRQLIQDLGYDMKSGRLDLAPHPFSSSFGPGDQRITTRLDEDDFFDGILSSLHETGHALYDQGLNKDDYGLPSGEPVSLSVHESQSRLYENHIGRSFEYVEAYLPLFKEYFPEAMKDVSPEQLYKALNKVQPSLIRTAADELTYHQHIIIRYELEKALIEKQLKPEDLSEAWNEKYKEYLGVDVPDDRRGVLQDIHWSHGSFGYFPTYSLGSFYSAQYYNTIQKAMPSIGDDISQKRFAPLREWLRKNIHSEGRLYDAGGLCEKVTGETLNPDYFLDYAKEKFLQVYEG